MTAEPDREEEVKTAGRERKKEKRRGNCNLCRDGFKNTENRVLTPTSHSRTHLEF